MVFITLVQAYLLTVGQDLTGLFEAVLATLRIRLPLACLWVHVQELAATEHGNLWLRHLGAWPIHLSHGQSLGRKGGEEGERRGERDYAQENRVNTASLKRILVPLKFKETSTESIE